MIGALIILSLISINAFEAMLDQANLPFFKQSLIGAMMVLKPWINRESREPVETSNISNSLGSGHSSMALTFSKSAETPLAKTTNPKKWTSVIRKVHILSTGREQKS